MRKLHRVIAIVASVFVLTSLFSGGYHALSKMTEDPPADNVLNNTFVTKDICLEFSRLQLVLPGQKISNVSLVAVNNKTYFQISMLPDVQSKKMQSVKQTAYIHASDYTVLKNGEQQYARHLSEIFSGYDDSRIKTIGLITSFNEEYPFVNKRLPVWRIQYASEGNERVYVETSSGALASKVRDQDLYEGYSFALLHKHHFMDWGGKVTRDTSTMVAAVLVFLTALIGVILWFRSLHQRRKKDNTAAQHSQ